MYGDAGHFRIGPPIPGVPDPRRRRRRVRQWPGREDRFQHSEIANRTFLEVSGPSAASGPQGRRVADPVAQGRVDRVRRVRSGLHGDEPRLRRAARCETG